MKLDQAMPKPWQILAKVQTFTRMLQIFKVYVYFPKSLRPYRTKNRTKKEITIIIHLDRLSSPIFFAPTSKSIHPSTHFKMKESSKATTWRGRHHLNLPHHQVGLPSKATTSSQSSSSPGGAVWRYPCPVVSSKVSCTWLTRRPRPSGSGGSPVDPARKTFAEHQGDKRVSRRSSGALEARRGSAEDF